MVTAITTLWGSIVSFLTEHIPDVESVFYTAGTSGGTGSFTLIGTFAIIGSGVAILLLGFNLIRSFVHMRG